MAAFYNIKQPETEEEFKRYYHLRWQLLRAPWNQPEGSEIDSIENQCFHLMATDTNDTVLAVSRLQFNSDDEAQIRYMAVVESSGRKGIGRALIEAMEQQARLSTRKKMVLEAREPAVGFYEKLGYNLIEKSHLLYGQIQHFRMEKAL
ncbi:MAG TPA: GNAT family N-acetyltransferase [Gammaproteobacteria bacterium]|nr:GNAT family N-acetyltransferase [Gammaproteobacteria bacterium]